MRVLKFKKENGNEITIHVSIFNDFTKLEFKIEDITIRPFRKQKSISLRSQIIDSYGYRRMEYNEREKHLMQEYLKYVTEEQLNEAILNTWEFIKSTEIKFFT